MDQPHPVCVGSEEGRVGGVKEGGGGEKFYIPGAKVNQCSGAIIRTVSGWMGVFPWTTTSICQNTRYNITMEPTHILILGLLPSQVCQ